MLLIEEGIRRTLHQLDRIPVPTTKPWGKRGEDRDQWQPIQHGSLARAVLQGACRVGLELHEAKWAVNQSETDLFGAIVFRSERGHRLRRGLRMSVALKHSNAGRYAVTFGFGAEVIVCTNGVLVGEHVLAKKHTKLLDLRAMIDDGFERFLASTGELVAFYDRLRCTRVAPATADRVLVEAGRRELMPWSKLGRVEREWRDASYPVFRKRNAWSLYNAFTLVAKQRPPARQLDCLRKLHELFDPQVLRRLT